MIVEMGGWDARSLRDSHHEWVDDLVDNCREVWDYMMQSDQFVDAPVLVREQVRVTTTDTITMR